MAQQSFPSQAVTGTTHYRLARPVMARFAGVGMIVLAVLVFGTTLLVALLEASLGWILAVAVLGVAAVLVLAWWLRAKAYVVRCSPQGYSVRFVRGAGAKEARWADVEEVVTAKPRGVACLVLKLKSGETTTIPVALMDVDRDQFVRDVQRHLGARPAPKRTPKRPRQG